MRPYFRPENELCSKLETSGGRLVRKSNLLGNKTPEHSIRVSKSYLPGQPRISLDDASELLKHLHSEFVTPDLDKFAPHLWLVATQDSSHISSLTTQLVRGRHPVITENPELHLVWVNDRVYLKPIPKYLLSHAFWEYCFPSKPDAPSPIPLDSRAVIYRATVGFMRSYLYLIRHKSDFRIATKEHYLIPKGIKYAEFTRFISGFQDATDDVVSPRYHFGELRLTRLNFWAKMFLGRFTFHKMHWQYAGVFRKYYGPLLFVFGYFSVALSAMQVVLAAMEGGGMEDAITAWAGPFGRMSRVFSVLTLIAMLVSVIFLVFVFLAHMLRELVFALRDLWRNNKARKRQKEMS